MCIRDRLYGALYKTFAGRYKPGTMLPVYDWDSGRYLGEIPQAAQTYATIGNTVSYTHLEIVLGFERQRTARLQSRLSRKQGSVILTVVDFENQLTLAHEIGRAHV